MTDGRVLYTESLFVEETGGPWRSRYPLSSPRAAPRSGREIGEPYTFEVIPLHRHLRDGIHCPAAAAVAGRQWQALRPVQRIGLPVHRRERASLSPHARSLRRRDSRADGAPLGVTRQAESLHP